MKLFGRKIDPIKTAQVLFYLNAAIWVLLGILLLSGKVYFGLSQSGMLWIIAILMFLSAAAMLVAGVGIGKLSIRWYLFAIAVLVVNLILTITDQVGEIDMITLGIDLLILGLLFNSRTQFLGRKI